MSQKVYGTIQNQWISKIGEPAHALVDVKKALDELGFLRQSSRVVATLRRSHLLSAEENGIMGPYGEKPFANAFTKESDIRKVVVELGLTVKEERLDEIIGQITTHEDTTRRIRGITL